MARKLKRNKKGSTILELMEKLINYISELRIKFETSGTKCFQCL